MRLDKFLWSVRYYKTRTLATDACKKNRIRVNGEIAKASKLVMIGDQLEVQKNQIYLSFKTVQIPKSRVGAKLLTLYILDTTPIEQYEILELRKLSQDHYRKNGEGRPTKKDRRNLDGFVDEYLIRDDLD